MGVDGGPKKDHMFSGEKNDLKELYQLVNKSWEIVFLFVIQNEFWCHQSNILIKKVSS